ncbi:glucan phosphoethanolaminetransferase (alkaline phosphatase superfamily) [Microbacterium resistens]|uniref:Glucan phosphoethanolaminetransferase (Alkaline phosphatase superfamily) n=1 Tax=Microbacterium resistens TaxID=156977 RepID=A0ABU1S8C9_9MICO|nr:hypothetical protein [Microbacterium resistens]MDR6865873.1 glucan phosphoethanolaminetransferase (alkaline phosphatase superfamily) [Microbacterium resistens]
MTASQGTGAVAGSRVASRGPRWLILLVKGVTGLFYAYAIWNAVAHLVNLAQLGLNPTGWFTMLFAIVFPALVYVAALAIARRRNVGELSLVMLAGLGVVAVFWLNIVGYTALNLSSLLVVPA